MPPLAARIDITQAPYSVVHSTDATPDVTTVLNVNRLAIQAAVDAVIAAGGGELYAPAGWNIPYNRNVVSGSYGIMVNTTVPVVFDMEGVTLRMNRASGVNDFYGIQVLGSGGVKFKGVTFSQYGLFNGSEQQHNVQVGNGSSAGAQYVDFIGCKFVDGVGGDGIRLLGFGYADATIVQDVTIDNCRFIDCDRSGISSQRGCRRVNIHKCFFSGTVDQDIDFEPTGSGSLGQYSIIGNTIIRAGNGSGSVTLTGQGSTDANDRSIFANNNVFGGRVSARKVKDLTVSGNVINTGATTNADAALDFGSYGPGIIIEGNTIVRPSTSVAGIVLTLEYDSDRPSDITVAGNHIYQETQGHAVKVDSIEGMTIDNNHVTATYSAGGYSAILVSADGATAYGYANDVAITNNKVRCPSTAADHGIRVVGHTTYKATALITGNRLQNCTTGITAANRVGGDPVADAFASPILINGNSFRSCTTKVSAGTYYAVGGSPGGVFDAIGSVAPDSVVVADIGSTYRRTDTGASYIKTSASGTSGGWSLAAGSPDPDLDVVTGTGSPEGVVTAGAGTVYVRTDVSQIWLKSTGAGNTGWRWLQ
jgi:hypothetical protein